MIWIGLKKEIDQKTKIKNKIKKSWYDWLTNFIPEPVRKSVGGFKDKIVVFLRQTHLNKLCMGEERN